MPVMEPECYRRPIIQRSHEPDVPPVMSIEYLSKSAEIVHI